MALTKRQKEVLEFIADYQVENDGVCPSYEEIARGLNLASIASAFGGGGHPHAAGYSTSGSAEDVVQALAVALG